MQRVLFLILFLLSVQSVAAVWDASTGIEEVGSGDVVVLENGYKVRILEVGDLEHIVHVSVEHRGKVIGSGAVMKDRPFTIKDVIKITYHGQARRRAYGPLARLQVFQWVDGRFVAHHFPQVMNLRSLYDVFTIVENTGTKDAAFTVELTQAGEYVRRADQYVDAFGNYHPRMLDVEHPFQMVNTMAGETARVDYNHLSPMRSQPGSTAYPIERSGDVLFNLYFGQQLLDRITIEGLQLTQTQSGYIEDIRMPQVLRRDQPVEIELDLLNAGTAYGGIERSKFNVRLENEEVVFLDSHREFKTHELQISPNLLRGNLPAFISSTWKVRLHPFMEPGDYLLNFTIGKDQQIFDRFVVPVEVQSGTQTLITSVDHAKSVDLGEDFTVGVTLKNTGLGRDLLVELDGPMIEKTLRQRVHIGTGATRQVRFNVPAVGSGIERLNVRLLASNLEDRVKNFDPYTTSGYTLMEKASRITVRTGEPTPEPEPSPETAPTPEPQSAPESAPEPAAPETKEPEWSRAQATPILVVALVLVGLLVLLKALFYYSR